MKYPKQKSYLIFFKFFFIILRDLNYPSCILDRNPRNFFFNYFYNFITFKLSFKYPEQKFYFHFFYIIFFYKFKTFKLSFKYPKQKSYLLFFLIIFIILKDFIYTLSILNRNHTYVFFINYFYKFKTFKLSFKYHK